MGCVHACVCVRARAHARVPVPVRQHAAAWTHCPSWAARSVAWPFTVAHLPLSFIITERLDTSQPTHKTCHHADRGKHQRTLSVWCRIIWALSMDRLSKCLLMPLSRISECVEVGILPFRSAIVLCRSMTRCPRTTCQATTQVMAIKLAQAPCCAGQFVHANIRMRTLHADACDARLHRRMRTMRRGFARIASFACRQSPWDEHPHACTRLVTQAGGLRGSSCCNGGVQSGLHVGARDDSVARPQRAQSHVRCRAHQRVCAGGLHQWRKPPRGALTTRHC